MKFSTQDVRPEKKVEWREIKEMLDIKLINCDTIKSTDKGQVENCLFISTHKVSSTWLGACF